jgi:hypothetical protein
MIEQSDTTPRAGDDPRRPRRNPLLSISIVLAILGAILLATGSLMPAYTDPIAAERIRSGSECERGVPNTKENSQCDSELWQRSMDSLRTFKWSLVDLGSGVLMSAFSIFAFIKCNGQNSWSESVTPRRSFSITALVGLAWWMQIPGYLEFFFKELSRGYYPWWADSIAIPMFEIESSVRRLFLPYLVVWLIFVAGGQLPVRVFSTIPGRPVVNVFWTVAAALLAVPIGLALIGAILDGMTLMVPFLWLTLWLVLCARAAALTRHRPTAERRQIC